MVRLAKLQRVDVTLLGLAFVLALTLNWESFAYEPLAIDEHVSFWIADPGSPSTLLTRSFRYSATPPLFFVFQRLSLALLGKHEWTLRLPAAAGFLAAIVAVWWSGRRWLSQPAGGIAAVLLAAHPAVLPIAVAARPYALGLLLSTLAVDAAARVDEGATRVRWAWLAAINLALIQTHYLFAAVWVAESMWLTRALWSGRLSVRDVFLWVVALFVCLATVWPGIWHVWNVRQYLNWTMHRPDFRDLCSLAVPARLEWLTKPLGWAVATLPILWQIVRGRYRPIDWFDCDRLWAGREFIVWCTLGSALPTAGLWLLGRFWLESLAADRYLIIFAPVVVIVWAGLCCVFRGTVAPLLALSVLMLWSGTAERLYHAAPLPTGWRAQSRYPYGVGVSVSARWKEAAEIISAQSPTGGIVLVGSGLTEMSLVPSPMFLNDPIFHDYVCCRLGRMYLQAPFRRLSLAMFWPQQLAKTLEGFYRGELARTCRMQSAFERSEGPSPPAIWLVAATDTDVLADTARRARSMLESAGAVEIGSWGFDGLEVVRYECPGAGPSVRP
jgi:4-amino-4-deoxy-L-arabinose transferase-like glycosyltransferase